MRRVLLVLVGAVALGAASPASAATANVNIFRSKFAPYEAGINEGDTVTWTNRDSVRHQVVAENGRFASPILRPGQSYSFTFDDHGVFLYRDALSRLRGKVDVHP